MCTIPEAVRRWLGQAVPDADVEGRAEILEWRRSVLASQRTPDAQPEERQEKATP